MYTEIGNFKINFINIGYTFGRNKERERGLHACLFTKAKLTALLLLFWKVSLDILVTFSPRLKARPK